MAPTKFEALYFGPETTRGTAVSVPTHNMNSSGVVKPIRTKVRPKEQRATLDKSYRSKTTAVLTEWDTNESPLDNTLFPIWCSMGFRGAVTATTPATATNTRDREYIPVNTYDEITGSNKVKTATVWFPQRDDVIWRAPYAFLQELTVKADAKGDGLVTAQAKGLAKGSANVSAPASYPAQVNGTMFPARWTQLFIDETTIGTTDCTSLLSSVEISCPTGLTPAYFSQGPTGDLSFTRLEHSERGPKITLELDLADDTYMSHWAADTVLKFRVRFNSDVIESTFRHFVEFDFYGPLGDLDWGEGAGSRLAKFVIEGQYHDDIDTSFRWNVRNATASYTGW